jgi:hypothetical protein
MMDVAGSNIIFPSLFYCSERDYIMLEHHTAFFR